MEQDERWGTDLRSSTDITRAIETHSDTVLRVCSVFFHNQPERDDAFQETFLKYAQSDSEFADDEHRKAWLIRVATNTCKDMLKSAALKVAPIDDVDGPEQTGWPPRVDGCSEPNSKADELNAALQQLDDKYRITLYLKYYEGYKAAEIASMLGIPENTVYTNLARGREKLKEVLTNGER